MSHFVTESVVVEETSVNPRHRLFLILRIRNYEAYTLYASYLGRNVWENHVFKMGEKKTPTGQQEIFLGNALKERIVHRTVACSIDFCYHSIQKRKIKTKTSRKKNAISKCHHM